MKSNQVNRYIYVHTFVSLKIPFIFVNRLCRRFGLVCFWVKYCMVYYKGVNLVNKFDKFGKCKKISFVLLSLGVWNSMFVL